MVRPLYDRVLIKRDAVDEKVGAIYIPTEAQERKAEGIIVSAGRGKVTAQGLVPMSVKEGDLVYFGPNAGVPVTIAGDEYLMMNEADLLGVKE